MLITLHYHRELLGGFALAGLIPGMGSLGRDSEPRGPDFRPSTILRRCRDLVNEKNGKYDYFELREEAERVQRVIRCDFGLLRCRFWWLLYRLS